MTLLLVLATCACWHAIESGKTRGLVLSGLLVGLAFLTKSLDAFLVVPALGLSYLCCGPPRLARRIGQLGWGAVALVLSSGWWVAVVELWPKGARPYIGGSTDNSAINLIFGYNGFSRVTGSGPVIYADGGQGLFRMFDFELGGQISWFLLLALVGAVGGFCLTRGRARTDRQPGGIRPVGKYVPRLLRCLRRRPRPFSSLLHRRDGSGRRCPRRSRFSRPVATWPAIVAMGMCVAHRPSSLACCGRTNCSSGHLHMAHGFRSPQASRGSPRPSRCSCP